MGPNLTKFLHSVEESVPFNVLKLELRYHNQFGMPVCWVKVGSVNLANLATKLVSMAPSLEQLGLQSEQMVNQALPYSTNHENMV